MVKFNPPRDLTLSELTQILREQMQAVPDDQKAQMTLLMPTLAQFMVEVPDV